jgi:hypothetical protein
MVELDVIMTAWMRRRLRPFSLEEEEEGEKENKR